jgi:DNA-binding NarL/FixJ family response regulator
VDGVTDDDTALGPRIPLVLSGIFLVVVVGGVIDLILDRPKTLFSAHVIVEVLMVAVSLGAASFLALGWYRAQSRLVETTRESARLGEERKQWEVRASEVLAGLGAEVARQLDEWELTPTERRVAFLLLKGWSHKRIARVSETSERTVRQHSVAVYRKSGLSGRAELAGFFLESMILPDGGAEVRPVGDG